jgi:hypothetical protein
MTSWSTKPLMWTFYFQFVLMFNMINISLHKESMHCPSFIPQMDQKRKALFAKISKILLYVIEPCERHFALNTLHLCIRSKVKHLQWTTKHFIFPLNSKEDQRHFWTKSQLQANQPQFMLQTHSLSAPKIIPIAYKSPSSLRTKWSTNSPKNLITILSKSLISKLAFPPSFLYFFHWIIIHAP